MNMALKIFAVSILVLASPAALSAKWIDLGGGLAAEKMTVIDISELWQAGDEKTLRASNGLVVGFWPADAESAARKNGWVTVGFAVSGIGDIAEKPVAIRLWSRQNLIFYEKASSSYEKKRAQIALFFYPSGCSTLTDCADKTVAVRFNLKDKTRVTVNTKSIGDIDVTP